MTDDLATEQLTTGGNPMPPHTRSQRRRQNSRQQPRRNASAETISRAPRTGTTVDLDQTVEAPTLAPAPAPVVARPASGAARPARSARRVISRPAPEPIDYSKDYAAARLDLTRIALWASLLFVAMIVLYFSGLV
jgi:hypothetical protein